MDFTTDGKGREKRVSGWRSIWANWKCHGLLNLGREPEELSSPCWVALQHLYPYIHSTSLASTSPDVWSGPPTWTLPLGLSTEDRWKVGWLNFRPYGVLLSTQLKGSVYPKYKNIFFYHLPLVVSSRAHSFGLSLSCLSLPKYNGGKLNFVYSPQSSENLHFPETVLWSLIIMLSKYSRWHLRTTRRAHQVEGATVKFIKK